MRTRHVPALGLAALLGMLFACSSGGTLGDGGVDGGSGGAIQIAPASPEVAPGQTVQFTATARSAPEGAVEWAVVEASGGRIDANGLYTAPDGEGTYTVTASIPSLSAVETTVVRVTAVPAPPPPESPPPEPTMGTGATRAPSYVAVTGGGPMPATAGAVTAACAGDGATDDTACLRSAAAAARDQRKPLLVPATNAFYRITGAITVYGSVIGVGGMPTLEQTATCSTESCVMLKLAPGTTGWITNLHLVGAYTGARGEYAHNISVGGVDGVTIKNNLLESPIGDNISDVAQESDGSAVARNVLIDGNTLVNPARCAVAIVNVSDRWAIMNNVISDDAAFVSTIDLEPWRAESYVSNVEVGYNRIDTPANAAETSAGNYVGVVTASGWYDASPGANVWAHHNWGSWPFARFVTSASHAGTFANVNDIANVTGDGPQP